MTSPENNTLEVTVLHSTEGSDDHLFLLNKQLNGSVVLNQKLSFAANGSEDGCGFMKAVDGKFGVTVAVTSGERERSHAGKLLDIVSILAEETGTRDEDVIVRIEKITIISLDAFRRGVNFDHLGQPAIDKAVNTFEART